MTEDNSERKKTLNTTPVPTPGITHARHAVAAAWHRLVHLIAPRSFSDGRLILVSLLIMTILLGGHIYAATRTVRGNEQYVTGSPKLTRTQQLTFYPADVRTSVMRMLTNGAKVENLIFDSPDKLITLSPEKKSLAVFLKEGGNAAHMNVTNHITVNGNGLWRFNAAFQAENIGSTSVTDTSGNDIIAFLPYVPIDLCRMTNEQMGIPAAIPESTLTLHAFESIQGISHPFPSRPGQIIGGAFSGKPFGCFRSADGIYTFFHIILER